MNTRNKGLILFSLLIVLSMVLAACAQATPEKIIETVVVTEIVEKEGETVVEEVIVTATPAPEEAAPEEGGFAGVPGVLRFVMPSDMTSLNVWYLFDDGGSSYYNYAVQGGYWASLFTLSDQRFDFIPSLAADFPTDLVEEGEGEEARWTGQVTMKEGLTWSDGSSITCADVEFTVNTALILQLGLNWNSAYDPNFLEKVECVDDLNVKFVFLQKPGLSRWQYGALQGPIVNKAYWEPLVADGLAIMDEIKDLDPASEDYVARKTEAVEMIEGIEPTGEPTWGMYKFSKWEVGAFAENVVNPEYFFTNMNVVQYANGAYCESVGDTWEFCAYGDPTGDIVLEYTAGPYFDTVQYSVFDQDAAVLAVRNNDADFFLSPLGLSRGFLEQLQEDPAIKIVENEQNGFRYMAFNHANEFLADPAFKQAVACMIDLEFATQQLLQGQALPAYTVVPPGNGAWYNDEVPRYCEGLDSKTRMETAVQTLKDAGYTWSEKEPTWNEDRGGSVDSGVGLTAPNGLAFPDVTLLAPSAGYDPLRATFGVFIEQWMLQLGIPVKAELTNFNNILDAVYNTGEYDMFILGWGVTIFPDFVCDFFYGTAESPNPYNYVNEELNAKCDVFYAESDLDTAIVQNKELQAIVATDLPYIVLFTNPVYDAYRNIDYPFTEVLDGLGSGYYGYPTIAFPLGAQ